MSISFFAHPQRRRADSPSTGTRAIQWRAIASLAAIALSVAGCTVRAQVPHDHATMASHGVAGSSPLLEKVRQATQRFADISVALEEGWVQATPCVSGPSEGAMGIHVLKPERLHDGVLTADEPEMLIYEPLPGGRFRLVGVEYIVLASDWARSNPPGSAPAVDGHLANFVAEPNRYALPAFYELHAWAFEENPNGSFSDWNSRVSCDRQLP
jgi:hypothetical protein